ncbi:MAG: hypothetical protein K2Y21_11750 [Phycisphaerales bacterium]|nr:hypothetical protein [Phycisphaerales bacterium]
MSRTDTGISLPGTADLPAPRSAAAVADLLAQAGDLADRAERTNRPTSLIALASAALVIALCMVGYYALARVGAASRYEQANTKANQVNLLVSRLQSFDKTNEALREQFAPLPNLQTLITEAATNAGLKSRPAAQTPVASGTAGDLVRRTWRYNDIREESLEKAFDWINRAVRIPGLELTGLVVKPEAQNWKLEVTFGRWERKN